MDPVSLLSCPFCGAEPRCSHGYEPCTEHEHYEDDGIACRTPPMCAIYCVTPLCPAGWTPLAFASDIKAIRESGPWTEPFKRAVEIWNKRAVSASDSCKGSNT